MPIYEYQCEACHHKMEALQKMADAPLTECPACQQPALKKLISAAAFKLKGSGWYETDFKNNNKPASTNKASADKPASE
ncbi:MAG TPA: FmdB family transcriptional regulator [Cellvibrionales bacterium]|jgi:putative FmdB family regulatory protein|nr:FmdB family transcriptional regulator [Cellvibrionales bacterium]